MAISVAVSAVATVDSSNTTSYATTNFTPTADNLLVYFVFASGTLDLAATMTGGSLTWTRRAELTSGVGSSLYVFTAPTGSSPASCTPTFDCSGDAATGAIICGYTVGGYDTSSPVVQTTEATTSGSDPALTFSTALLTTSGYMTAIGVNRTAPAYAPPNGSWSENCDTGYTTPNTGMASFYRAGGETGTTYTSTGATGQWAAIGIEIRVQGVAGTVASPGRMMMGMGS